MLFKIALVTAMATGAMAACPNSCSGHGTCGTNEVCTCYDGWGMGGAVGGDCSDRFCSHELAWVDTPDRDGKTHQYAECAARGVCDRETGECECFGGYEGKACGRQTCPDSCSGHGTCEYANELTFGTVYNDYYDGSATAYYGLGVGAHRPAATDTAGHWDADRARACVCDAGWSGVNCVSRMCPWGNDVMDTRLNADTSTSGGTLVYQVQTITLYSGGTDGGQKSGVTGTFTFAGGIFGADFVNRAFALSFTSKTNETYTTAPIALQSGDAAGITTLGSDVTSALTNLPNRVITGVTATAARYDRVTGHGIQIAVTFNGNSVHGQQNLLEVHTNPCTAGCSPQLGTTLIDGGTALASRLVTNTNTTSSVTETQAADYNSFECGRRGKCDDDTGLCACFEGYTGESCTMLTALI